SATCRGSRRARSRLFSLLVDFRSPTLLTRIATTGRRASDRPGAEAADGLVGPEHDQDVPVLEPVGRPGHETPFQPLFGEPFDRQDRDAVARPEPGIGDRPTL